MRYPRDLLTQISSLFADLFVERGTIERILETAHIAPKRINLEQNALAVWHDAVNEADALGLIRALLAAALHDFADAPASPAAVQLRALERSAADYSAQMAAQRFGGGLRDPKNETHETHAGWNG